MFSWFSIAKLCFHKAAYGIFFPLTMWEFVFHPLPVTGKSTFFFSHVSYLDKVDFVSSKRLASSLKDHIRSHLNQPFRGNHGWQKGMKRIVPGKCHPHWAEESLNAFQMPLLRLDDVTPGETWKNKQDEGSSHISGNVGLKGRLVFFFFPGCLGLHILAARDAIRLFVEIANLLLNHL